MAASYKVQGVVIVMVLLLIITSPPCYARLLMEKVSLADTQVMDKYRPLLLNLLPKGPVPPSAPSKRTNDSVN
ncbi:hypothetical protein MANES_08G173600v8 [Manihot esculenta]|uniref:Transmembrane protein n=1 Tax=Manihot esculenta TaxID=3983 RepID=A0A2C9VH66_MANES|nr:hypothetical protein MANES_08G173600v8 [Manihot esculenta]